MGILNFDDDVQFWYTITVLLPLCENLYTYIFEWLGGKVINPSPRFLIVLEGIRSIKGEVKLIISF